MSQRRKRVLVAMSGGVDSSVAASLLVEQGYEVIGVTMQVWDYSSQACDIEEGNGTCCSSSDVDDARAVADHLNIPFYVINCEEPFKEKVIKNFIGNYLQGKTPIPCVDCNTYMKFDHLIDKMKELECDHLATGHYAQVGKSSISGQPSIITSEDGWKDQTYFLFTLNKEVISYLMFPVGHWQKPQLRAYAKEKGLPVFDKKDSTGICFIGNGDYSRFIEDHVPSVQLKRGRLRRYPKGDVLGEHTGVHNFTYGQRKGLGISSDRPLYVVKVDAESGDVWLGEDKDLYSQKMHVVDSNWLDEVQEGESLRIKIRFQHRGAQGTVRRSDSGFYVDFDEPQRAITPGQAAVFYREQQLLGGGWIE